MQCSHGETPQIPFIPRIPRQTTCADISGSGKQGLVVIDNGSTKEQGREADMRRENEAPNEIINLPPAPSPCTPLP